MNCTTTKKINVPEFGEHYTICNCGEHVKSIRIDRHMTIRVDAGGKHTEVNLSLPGGTKKKFKIHELMAATFCHGYDPVKYKVVHVDKNTKNNHIQNITIQPHDVFVVDCAMQAINHPDFPELTKNYKVCRCGKHVLSMATGAMLSAYKSKCGYMNVSLKINDKKHRCIPVHHLVAYTYLRYPVDEGTYIIDHINRDRCDNRIENLRFATYSENNTNATRNSKLKPIVQYTLTGDVFKEYNSITEALQLNPGWSSAGICICLRNTLLKASAYGFRWQYKYERDKNVKYEAEDGEVFKDVVDVPYYNVFSKTVEKISFPKYQISNQGRVINKKTRYIVGYDDGVNMCVTFLDEKKKTKLFKVHTLVAALFVASPSETDYIIRFKDGNQKNVKAENLEWTSMRDTMIASKGSPVVGIAPNGEELSFRSISEAVDYLSRTLEAPQCDYGSSIRACLSGYQDTAYGYRWKEQDKDTLQDN